MKEKTESYLELNKKFAELYKSLGYSEKPLYEYQEVDEDLMDYEGYSEFAKKFNIKRSAMNSIMKTITNSAAYQRTSQKSMMSTIANTIITPEEEKYLDNIEKVKLIENITAAIIFGKPISEENAQKLKEDTIKKINEYIETQNKLLNEEEKSELEEIYNGFEALIQTRQTHMREVADIARMISDGLGLNEALSYIIGVLHDIGHTSNGHTGERILSAIAQLNDCGYIVHNAMAAYIMDRESIINDCIENALEMSPGTQIEEMKEFMRYVIDGIVSHNGEGVVGKIIPKDKTSEEMSEEIKKCFTEKGFDKGIMPATMEGAVIRYADIIAYTRSDMVDGFRLKDAEGNKILDEFDDEYLSIIGTVWARKDNYENLLTLENKFLLELQELSRRIDELALSEDKTELERTKKERSLIEAKYKEFEQYKIQYAKEYLESIPEGKRKTIIPNMMQDVFIKDLVEASKEKNIITMTPLMRRTLFALRNLNVNKIVPYTRRAFEMDILPSATNKLISKYTDVLIDTGIAYDLIPDKTKTEIMPKNDFGKQKEVKATIENGKNSIFKKKLCHYYENQNKENISYMYENVIDAMEDITKHDIAIALGEEKYTGELSKEYKEKIKPLREKIKQMGITKETITEDQRHKIFDELIEEKKKDIERKIAAKMAIEYVAGMTDNTLLAVLMVEKMISQKAMIKGYGRPKKGKGGIDVELNQTKKAFDSCVDKMIDDDELYNRYGDDGEICL